MRESVLRWTVWLAVAAAAASPHNAGAQDGRGGPGSRNLPVDDWAYEYIKRLRSRGYLANLNPLIQPYRRHEVAIGLARLDPDTLGEPVAHWVRVLRDEFGRELTRLEGGRVRSWGVPLRVGASASSGQRLDPLRPIGDEGAWPNYIGGAWVETGPLSVEARVKSDEQLEDEPEGPSDQGRVGRTDNGYLSIALPFGDIWFGRLKQNWGLLGSRGLIISDVPAAYPQLSFDLRAGRFSFRQLTGELEAIADTIGFQQDLQRYVSARRIDYQTDNFVVSLGEALIYATRTGLQLRFLNPLEGSVLQSVNATTSRPRPGDPITNTVLQGQVWFRVRGVEVVGDLMIDDIDVRPQGDAEPFTYAFSFEVRLPSVVPWLEAGLSYQQVSAFAYRGPFQVDEWTFLDRGLAQNFSDYDRLTLGADLFVGVPGLQLTPTIQVQRQGEGDLRDDVPPRAIHVASPAIFLGTKEITYRIGLRGRFQPNRFVWLAWDVGRNVYRDRGHVVGDDFGEFSAAASAGVAIEVPWGR